MNPLGKIAKAHWLVLSLIAVVVIGGALAAGIFVKGKGQSSSADGSILSASPNPITVCPGASSGSTTLAWNIPATTQYELYQGIYPGGTVIAQGSGSGQKVVTGTNNGSTYSLVGITVTTEWQYKNRTWVRVPAETRAVLASLQVMHTTQGCTEEAAPLVVSVVSGASVVPGQSYVLSATQNSLPYKGAVDVKSTFCPIITSCNPSAVYSPWVTFDQAGKITIPTPTTIPVGTYKAQVRPANMPGATWSNEISIVVSTAQSPTLATALVVTPNAQEITQGQSYVLTATKNNVLYQGEVDVESTVCAPTCGAPTVVAPWAGVRFGSDGKATIPTQANIPVGTYKARIRSKADLKAPWSNQFSIVVKTGTPVPVGNVQKGWDYGLTRKCVRTPELNIANSLSLTDQCLNNGRSWMVAVQSETPNGSVYGPTNQSLPINSANGNLSMSWNPYTNAQGQQAWEVKMSTDFNRPHPAGNACGSTGCWTWYVFMDHPQTAGGPYPRPDLAVQKVRVKYKDLAQGNATSRLIVGATGVWNGKSHVVEINLDASAGLISQVPSGYLKTNPGNVEFIGLMPWFVKQSGAFDWNIRQGEYVDITVPWGEVFKWLVGRGLLEAPQGGWVNTTGSNMLIGTEFYSNTQPNLGSNELSFTDFKIEEKQGSN